MNTPTLIQNAAVEVAALRLEIAEWEHSLKVHEASATIKISDDKRFKNAESRAAAVTLYLANDADYQEETQKISALRQTLATAEATWQYHKDCLRIEVAQIKGE